jgi:L-aminopeptidase/D-esterase-like protein
LDGICDVPGVRAGHATDREGLTGCTAVVFDGPAVVGVDVRGSAPGTRETDRLAPTASVRDTHALLLTGGSAFGLAAADGVVRLLEEQGRGLDLGVARIPLVSAAVIFDLMVGAPAARPDAAMGYEAALSARSGKLDRGSVGVGTGATVGKVLGLERAMKGGVGGVSTVLEGGATVAALAVVNAFGDVRDSGSVIAGPRLEDGTPGDTVALLERAASGAGQGENTTLGIIVTDATLDKTEATKVARMAHDGLARAVWPVHTGVDGDAIFAASLGSTGEHEAATDVVGVWAAWAMQEAVLDAVRSATGLPGIPGLGDRHRPGTRGSDNLE